MAKQNFDSLTAQDAITKVEDFKRTNTLLLRRLSAWHTPHGASARVYAHGWGTKLSQAAFALQCLEGLARAPAADSGVSTAEYLNYSERVSFYTDAFWAFLYATFDIGAQLANQVLLVNTPERGVNLNQNFVATWPAGSVKDVADKIIQSTVYTDANHYRNTSLHRREICVNFVESRSAISTSYVAVTSAPAPMIRKAELVCDDPFDVVPQFTKKRPIVGFSAHCLITTASLLKDFANAVKKAVP